MYGTAGGLRGYGQHMGKVFQTMSAPGIGLLDFGMDAIGNLPGAAPIDNWWDKQTEFEYHFNIGYEIFIYCIIKIDKLLCKFIKIP